MQNIHVERYAGGSPFAGSVAPEDRSWIVFVAKDGEATFWRRTEKTELPSQVEYLYVDAELPSVGFSGSEPLPTQVSSTSDDPLDFTVRPMLEPFGDAIDPAMHAAERAAHPEARQGFGACLNVRSVISWGATEHEAVRGLLNYVAKLCTAGCLDHTGQPVAGNRRRYEAVFGRP